VYIDFAKPLIYVNGTLFAYGFVSGGPTSKQISKEVQDEHNRKNSSFDRFGVDADLSC
jgi:hypothetical protein